MELNFIQRIQGCNMLYLVCEIDWLLSPQIPIEIIYIMDYLIKVFFVFGRLVFKTLTSGN